MAPIPSAHGPTEFAPDASPVMLRMASSPQAPASLLSPGAQFRKNLWRFRNQRPKLGFWGCQQSFRNWAPGASTNAGCWAADTGRGLRGGINTNTGLAQMSTEPLGLFALASDGVAYSGNKTSEPDSFIFDAATVWGEHAGAEFAPVHVWQPLCLYLGRPS